MVIPPPTYMENSHMSSHGDPPFEEPTGYFEPEVEERHPDRAKKIAQILTRTQQISLLHPTIPKNRLPGYAIAARERLASMGLLMHRGPAFIYTPLGKEVLAVITDLEEAEL